MKEVNDLVIRYGGSFKEAIAIMTALIEAHGCTQMYSRKMMNMFRTKINIFDPDNIFNPHKKTDANWHYSMSHIRDHF